MLVLVIFVPELVGDIYEFPKGAQTMALVLSSMGFLLSLLILLGSTQRDYPVCVPFLFYDGFCVLLIVGAMISGSILGFPFADPEDKAVKTTATLITLVILLALHAYALWVCLVYVLEMRYARIHHYEQVRSLESMTSHSSQRRGSRSPVFKIPDDEE